MSILFYNKLHYLLWNMLLLLLLVRPAVVKVHYYPRLTVAYRHLKKSRRVKLYTMV